MTQKEYVKELLPLVDNVLPMACRMLGNKEKAEDIVQEVLLSLWDKRKRLSIQTSYKAFLYRTVQNKCLDTLKQHQKLTFTTQEEWECGKTEQHSEFDTMNWIHNCIKTLPQLQQDIVNMREIDGLEFSEISELLGLKEAHIRVLLSRAKRTLQEILPKGL